MSEYLDLYEAIWEKAVEDDINEVVKELYITGFNSAYELFIEKRIEKKTDAIVDFNDNETVTNVIKVIKELQAIKILGEFKNATLYGANNNYLIIADKTFYIIKNIKSIKKFNTELLEYCKIKAREIEQRIKELVYQEAQDWPYNKDYKLRDKEYNKILTQLKEEVADYAIEKMKRCWYKL